jgi:hypothetical protein
VVIIINYVCSISYEVFCFLNFLHMIGASSQIKLKYKFDTVISLCFQAKKKVRGLEWPPDIYPFLSSSGKISTFFRLKQYKREGMQLHFHISRHIAHLGWETPVFFYTFYLVYIWPCRIKLFLRHLPNIIHDVWRLLILSNEEKTNDYENFEKGMIYMKILKKGGVVEKRGRRKRNPCPMRLLSALRNICSCNINTYFSFDVFMQ